MLWDFNDLKKSKCIGLTYNEIRRWYRDKRYVVKNEKEGSVEKVIELNQQKKKKKTQINK